MNPINAMGLKVAGLTSVVMLLLSGLFFAGKYGLDRYQQNVAPQVAHEALLDTIRTDSDGDNLPDQFEPIYRTDAQKADTDGDGINDFEEIRQGKDPAVAGISDESKPLTGEDVIDPANYTERYLNQLPTNASRDDILDQATLEAFVNLNQGELLPSPASTTIKSTSAKGKEAVASYLDQISASHNAALAPVNNDDIQQAFTAHQQSQAGPLEDIINKLDQNIRTLRTVEAPDEVADMHAKLLAASEALLRNTQLLAAIREDFVGALIGTKNIERLGPIFQEIAKSVRELEIKYSLK